MGYKRSVERFAVYSEAKRGSERRFSAKLRLSVDCKRTTI